MILRVCYFTKKGKELATELMLKADFLVCTKSEEESLHAFVQDTFKKHIPLLFVGACGIAVRAIAPYVQDKLFDSPVLVMDEKGEYVIPILSGHVGGANRYALLMQDLLGATPIITTATDVEHTFSADVFAVKNGLSIMGRNGIKAISGKLLRGDKISVQIDPAIDFCETDIPKELELVPFGEKATDLRIVTDETWKQNTYEGDLLVLKTKDYVCGMGCRKGKDFDALKELMDTRCPFEPEVDISAIASIDLKKKEEGICTLAAYYHVPFVTYSANQLMGVSGSFAGSAFVEQITGVDNVCERAALLQAGEGGSLIVKKQAMEGMTFAIAQKVPRIHTWNTEPMI